MHLNFQMSKTQTFLLYLLCYICIFFFYLLGWRIFNNFILFLWFKNWSAYNLLGISTWYHLSIHQLVTWKSQMFGVHRGNDPQTRVTYQCAAPIGAIFNYQLWVTQEELWLSKVGLIVLFNLVNIKTKIINFY